jgi:hypothetical protein
MPNWSPAGSVIGLFDTAEAVQESARPAPRRVVRDEESRSDGFRVYLASEGILVTSTRFAARDREYDLDDIESVR